MTNRNKKISLCTVIFLFTSLLPTKKSWAGDEETTQTPMFEAVSPLKTGERAPFEGILLSKDLASRIEAEKKTSIDKKLCDAKLQSSVDSAKSELNKKLEILNVKYETLEEKHRQVVDVKDSQIDFLREKFEPPPWYKEPAFLVSIGLISGAGLAIGAAYIVNLVK